jgi:predicted dehydrogenase
MICVSLEEFLNVKAEKERCGGVITEALRCDFDPPILKIRELLPKIGKVKKAHFEYCQYSSRYDAFKRGEVLNAFNPKMKNSALADIGIYPLHLCISLFDTPHSLSSKSVFLHNGFEAEGNVSLDYGDMTATVKYSKIIDTSTPSIIEGECGSIIIDRVNGTGKVTLALCGEAPIDVPITVSSNNMEYEIAEFIRIAKGDADGNVYLDWSEKTMRCVDEIYRQSGIKF